MLRFRLPVLVLATTTVALLAVSLAALGIFARQQVRDHSDLLRRELDRVAQLLSESVLGESFLDSDADLMDLQFVRTDGVVVVPADATAVIPLVSEPAAAQFAGRPVLAASRPWLVAGNVSLGTIRLAYDVRPALEGRRELRIALLGTGGVIAIVAGLAGMLMVHRQLRPLTSLAKAAQELDPATPDFNASEYGNDEVGSVARALEGATNAIAERTLAERQALGTVAHELGAPLSVMAGQLEALSQESDDPRLLAARDAANELLHTSQDLLALAQGDLRTRVELEVTSLGKVVESVVRSWPSASVSTKGDDQVLGSPPRLAQVVRNLLRNSVQSGATNVWLRVSGSEESVQLSVADDGPGIDQADWPLVFDREYSGNSAGNGIGLAVVKQLVQAHAGSATVRDSAAGGAEFLVVLPSLVAELESTGH